VGGDTSGGSGSSTGRVMGPATAAAAGGGQQEEQQQQQGRHQQQQNHEQQQQQGPRRRSPGGKGVVPVQRMELLDPPTGRYRLQLRNWD
jgi:hypothetical protein